MDQRDILADAKGRVNLGSDYAGQRFFITHRKDLDSVILEKAALIPERELWLHKNKDAQQSVFEGIQDAKKGKIKKNAINLDSYTIDEME
jgi:hypothetical protein